jgi:hypothetical protein
MSELLGGQNRLRYCFHVRIAHFKRIAGAMPIPRLLIRIDD